MAGPIAAKGNQRGTDQNGTIQGRSFVPEKKCDHRHDEDRNRRTEIRKKLAEIRPQQSASPHPGKTGCNEECTESQDERKKSRIIRPKINLIKDAE